MKKNKEQTKTLAPEMEKDSEVPKNDENVNINIVEESDDLCTDNIVQDDINDEKIKDLEQQVGQNKEQMLRALAEVENVKKRTAREKEEVSQYAITTFARDILAVADNLDRAISSMENSCSEQTKSLLEGVKITSQDLHSTFVKYKIVKIKSLGEIFNPEMHQAMFEVDNNDKVPGTIVEEMQIGYTICDRLLRPSMVGVTKHKKKNDTA